MSKKWSDKIRENDIDIYSEIDQLQNWFKKGNVCSILFTISGGVMLGCPHMYVKLIGLFLALAGTIIISLLRSLVQTKLSMYCILKRLQEKE